MANTASSPILCFGEVLWDLLPSGKVAGGAPMNVAMRLHRLGRKVKFVSRVGEDDMGTELMDYLKQEQLDVSLVQTDPQHPTGRVNVDVSDPTEVRYDIEAPAAWDFIAPNEANQSMAGQASLLVYGSLAARNEVSHACLLALIEQAPLRVFDVNLRPPHFSHALLDELLQHTDWLKLNHHELEMITDGYGETGDREARMRALAKRHQLSSICVTLGGDGAMMLQEGKLYQQAGFSVTVADTIGSGDSFLAAWIHQMMDEQSPQHCLKYACAIGALVASKAGATPPLDEKEVQAFMNA